MYTIMLHTCVCYGACVHMLAGRPAGEGGDGVPGGLPAGAGAGAARSCRRLLGAF